MKKIAAALIVIISMKAFAEIEYRNIPESVFSELSYQIINYDAQVSLEKCKIEIQKQKSLVVSLGYTIINEIKCEIKNPNATGVYGKFQFIK